MAPPPKLQITFISIIPHNNILINYLSYSTLLAIFQKNGVIIKINEQGLKSIVENYDFPKLCSLRHTFILLISLFIHSTKCALKINYFLQCILFASQIR